MASKNWPCQQLPYSKGSQGELSCRGVLFVFADLDRKFCFKELAVRKEGLPNIQRCIYCELIVDPVISFPSYSLKIMPERFEVIVADWGVDLPNIGGVGHSDLAWGSNARQMNLLLLSECSMVCRKVASLILIDLFFFFF